MAFKAINPVDLLAMKPTMWQLWLAVPYPAMAWWQAVVVQTSATP